MAQPCEHGRLLEQAVDPLCTRRHRRVYESLAGRPFGDHPLRNRVEFADNLGPRPTPVRIAGDAQHLHSNRLELVSPAPDHTMRAGAWGGYSGSVILVIGRRTWRYGGGVVWCGVVWCRS